MTLAKSVFAGAAVLALSSGVAAAAVAQTDLNLRSGPSVDNAVIDVIPDGARVAVLGCTAGWCRVNYKGEIGYASAAYLGGSQVTVVSPPVYSHFAYGYEPYVYDYGYYPGPSVRFGLSFGGRTFHHRHGRFARHGHPGGGHEWNGHGGGQFAWHGSGGAMHGHRAGSFAWHGNPGAMGARAQAGGGGMHFGHGGGIQSGGGHFGRGGPHFGHSGGAHLGGRGGGHATPQGHR